MKASESIGNVVPLELHQINPQPASKYPNHYFTYLGEEWRIFKRRTGSKGKWYFLIERGGKRFLSSLRTVERAAAVENAKLLIEAERQQRLDKMRAVLAGKDPDQVEIKYCTCVQYLEEYEKTATGENLAESRHRAVLAFKRLAGGADNLPATMDKLAPMFKAARARVGQACELADSNAAKMSLKRSFNSEMANAASTFSELTVFHLKDHLVLPDFTELRSLVKFLRFLDAKKTTEQYNPPPAKVLEATLDAWTKLPRNEFLAVGMALACGMRRREIRDFADWSWFEVHGGYLWCNARAGDFKDGTNILRCQVLEPFWGIILARMKSENWKMEGRMITVNLSDFDRNISEWMRGLGWETTKHLHALRAWAGSLVFQKYGAPASAAFCRHSSEQTTRDHYAWLKQDWHTQDAPVIIGGKNVEWRKE